MYYLVDTTPENGCLRVIPEFHIHGNSLHRELQEATAEDFTLAAFSTRTDEIDVMLKGGDLVVGDARILHASHYKSTHIRRTVITHPRGMESQCQTFTRAYYV